MSDKLEAALHGQTAVERVKMEHVPKEVFFGYPVDPETGDVVEGHIETCMCGERMPCTALRAVEELEAVIEGYGTHGAVKYERRERIQLRERITAVGKRARRAEQALARVRALHGPVTHPGGIAWCSECSHGMPCATIRAVAAGEQTEGGGR